MIDNYFITEKKKVKAGERGNGDRKRIKLGEREKKKIDLIEREKKREK